MSKLVHNERTKYVGMFLNNLGIAAMAAGVFIPLFSVDPSIKDKATVVMLGGFAIGMALFSLSLTVLGLLRE